MVVNVAEMPIKCPVAPLEFLFLADWYFHQKGMRDKVEMVYSLIADIDSREVSETNCTRSTMNALPDEMVEISEECFEVWVQVPL